MMSKLKIMLLMITALSTAIITGCNKENNTTPKDKDTQEPTEIYGSSNLIVKMTDAPVLYDSVNVEVLQVAVHYCTPAGDTTLTNVADSEMTQPMADFKDGDDDECDSTQFSGWIDLETAAGMYNLLDLQNNVTAVLVNSDTIPAGHITQMRLILGENNYLVVDSVSYDMTTPSAQQSGLKINLNATFEEGSTYEIILDFDAEQSIVVTGNGKYILKPVIKVVSITEITS